MTLNDKIHQLMEQHPDLFPTEAKFWSYLRGCLRRGLYEKSPMKHRYKQSKMGPPPKDYTGKGKKGAYCELSGEWEMTSKMEVDHKEGNKRLLFEEDIIPYIIHLLASGDDELQVVSKEAHKIKSHQERYGFDTFEEAKIAKEAIAFEKASQAHREAFFDSRGVVPPKSKKAQRELYTKLRKEEDNV